jgi:tetraacyldisaccharide 4'-kinase
MTPPGWWATDNAIARALAPAAALVAAVTARRVARPGWVAPIPVICCGNASVGGTGKTTLALDLAARLAARGAAPHILLRGYGRRTSGLRRATPDAPLAEIGDEARLLAAVAPTWVGADRAEAARAAIAAGAGVLILDDGLQNPTLAKTASLLVIDGAAGFGNGRVLPAGPLREPVAAAAARCRAAILIGPDTAGGRSALSPSLPVLPARLAPDGATRALAGRRVFAFAGIGRPAKFYATLTEAGALLAGTRDFPDHHPYTPREIEALLARADAAGALAVTTPKDAARLAGTVPDALRDRLHVAGVTLEWLAPDQPDALLDAILEGR